MSKDEYNIRMSKDEYNIRMSFNITQQFQR